MDNRIEKAAGEIAMLCSPLKIYLISQKTNIKGELIGFKLGIILSGAEVRDTLEEELYIQIDCDVPYDFVLYSADEWEELSEEPGTFAWKIKESGIVIYG